jgi:hypothetical protein
MLIARGQKGAIDITVTGGTPPYQYSWTSLNGGFSSTSEDVSGLAAGGYSVTVTDAFGCKYTANILVRQGLSPLAISASTVRASCKGNDGSINLTVTGGAAPLTYSWTGPRGYTFTGEDPSGIGGGTYNVIIIDGNSCTTTASVEVDQVNSTLAHSLFVTDASCAPNSGSIDLGVVGGNRPYTYLWSNGATTQDLTNIPAGSYTVTITDARECRLILDDIVVASTGTPLVATATAPAIACGQTIGTITVDVSSGTPPYTYSLNGGAFQSSKVFNNLPAGDYIITAKGGNDCSVDIPVKLVGTPAPAAPTASVTTQPTCTATTGTITVTAPAPAAGITYSIDGTTYTNTTGVFNSVAPGNYNVTVKNAAGCISSATAVVVNAAPSAPAAPTASVTTQPTCTTTTGTITVSAPAPAAGITYSIDGTTYTNTTGVFNSVAPGNYNVTVKNAAGCISSATAVVVNAAPTAPAAPTASVTTQPTCTTTTGTITVTAPAPAAGITYSIDGTTYTNTTGVFNSVAPGNYNVTVKNAAGCISSATALTVNAAPTAPAAPTASVTTQPTCTTTTGTITVSAPAPAAGISYSIDGTTYTNTTGVFNSVAPGNYNVTVKNAAGCISSATAANG